MILEYVALIGSPTEDNPGWGAFVPQLGAAAAGDCRDEAMLNAVYAAESILEEFFIYYLPIPKPLPQEDFTIEKKDLQRYGQFWEFVTIEVDLDAVAKAVKQAPYSGYHYPKGGSIKACSKETR